MRTPLAILLATVHIVSGCASGPAGWLDADVHVVDGYWVGAESECQLDDRVCEIIIGEAVRTLEAAIPVVVVADTSIAAVPGAYRMATGETAATEAAAGILTRTFVMLDLVDGSRHVVPLVCYRPTDGEGRPAYFPANGPGPLIVPAECSSRDDIFETWRVGSEPFGEES